MGVWGSNKACISQSRSTGRTEAGQSAFPRPLLPVHGANIAARMDAPYDLPRFDSPHRSHKNWWPLEQNEPDRQTSSSHPPSTRLPYYLLGRIDPGNLFPEFLEMRANISIEHQPQAGRPDSVQKARDGNHKQGRKNSTTE
jgi:hypothetical protein